MSRLPSSASSFIGIQTKLLGALGLGLALVVACGLAGLVSAWSNLGNEVPPELAQSSQAQQLGNEFRLQVQEWKNVLLRGHDAELRARHLAAFDKKGSEVERLAAGLAGAADQQAAALAARFGEQHRALDQQYHDALVQFEAANYDAEAGDALVRGLDRPLGVTLDALAARTRQLADAAIASKAAHARKLLVFAGSLMIGVALVLVAALTVWLRRSVIRPIIHVANAVRAVADGDLSRIIRVTTRDEIGMLAEALKRVTGTLQHLIAQQREMRHRHDIGEISFRMDEAAFSGDYALMVHEANACVAQHIGVKMRVVEVIQRYAIGDLSVDMDRLPGEKAAITRAMDAVKASLSEINGEIRQLGQAAANGDFSRRGDDSRFQHDFREMVRTLNGLMATTEDGLRAIAEGDLTHRMEGDFHGVFAQMRDDANATVAQLTEIVGRIQGASGSINLAAGEIAQGNNDLSRRTEQQAANLEETAASMEELTSTVKQNAEHARQANQLAQGAASVASQGGAVVSEVVTTMGDIEASSKKIAEIISVIDGIAFQTNILALNAAVEAARAGEQGRGFAVVASEVRTLAQRSANAAKEIKGLIDDSVEKVADGSALVHKAGATMGEIVASVQRVTDIMAEISAASQEQSAGIEQVNQTITQMDETTQQNAALVEEATAAARAMEEQAGELADAVSRFKLAQHTDPRRVLRAA